MLSFAFLNVACGGPRSPAACDAQTFRAVQRARATRTEVTVCGTIIGTGVVRSSRSGPHRIFVVDAGQNDPVEIDANLTILGDLPVRRGESAIVHGEYYYDASGREGVHWTHRTVHGNHPAGFIVLDGTTYR